MRVLVVAAHPDDEVYGVGGTLARHKEAGDETFVCIVTEGCSQQYRDLGEKKLAEITHQKKKEAKESAKILGVKEVFFLDLPDMQLDTIAHTELNGAIESCIKEVKPDILYTHHWGDVNKDHKLVFESTMVATRPGISWQIKRVLLYETPSSTEWNAPLPEAVFLPNVYVDISETLKKKLAAMKAYKSELRPFPHPRSIKAVKTYSEKNGLVVAKSAAEAFRLIREVI
ncbi:MAG: PIG-L deacetylase family protein [bacterium]